MSWELKTIYYYSPSKFIVKKKFEDRQIGETFSNYYFDKLVLANKVPIDESELLEYLIDPTKVCKIKQEWYLFVQFRTTLIKF